MDDFPGTISVASQSRTTLFCPTTDPIAAPPSFCVSPLWVENVCLNEALTRFGRPDCSTLARLCVWEEPRWTDDPLNAAVATASLVWSKERGWSWSAQTSSEVSEFGLVGTGVWNLVAELLSGAEVLWHPVQLRAKSLSLPLNWLLPSYDSQGRGFLTVNENEDRSRHEGELLVSWRNSSPKMKFSQKQSVLDK